MSCSTTLESPQHPSGLVINEINPNKWTLLVKQNLLQLSQVYDIAPFIFTKTIHIESKVIPRSHPVLTLNTRFAESPKKLLAVFLNQEFQWWLKLNEARTLLGIQELKKIAPKAPITEALGKDSTYLKMLAAQLEVMALELYLGAEEKKKLLSEKISIDKQDPWIYKFVQSNEEILKKILQTQKLLPPPLN
jgi:hypothetical protein